MRMRGLWEGVLDLDRHDTPLLLDVDTDYDLAIDMCYLPSLMYE